MPDADATARSSLPQPSVGRMHLGTILVVTVLSATTWPTPALAQSAESKAAADALFDAAKTAMDAQDYGTACPKFADSQALDPGVGTLLNLARCYDLAGKTSSAYSTYREAAAFARTENQGEREQFARAEVKRLEEKLTRLVITVGEQARATEGLTISRGGSAVPETMWGVPTPVDPGVQVIEIAAPGHKTVEASVTVEGEGQTVTWAVPALEPGGPERASGEPTTEPTAAPPGEEAPAGVAAAKDGTPADAGTRHGPGAAPWLLGGIGLVAVGVGTGFAVMGLGQNNQAKGICVEEALCPASDIDSWWAAHDAAQTDYTIAYIGWGVGAAAVLGSVIWLVASGHREHARTWQLTPVATGRVFGLSAGGQF